MAKHGHPDAAQAIAQHGRHSCAQSTSGIEQRTEQHDLRCAESQPARSFSDDAQQSASPSMRPSRALEAPAIVVKKTAKTEKIISELRSVRKLARPSLRMSGRGGVRGFNGHPGADGPVRTGSRLQGRSMGRRGEFTQVYQSSE